MTWRERTLLVLAIVGFVVPNTMVAIFAIHSNVDVVEYYSLWFESLPSSQLVFDIAWAGIAFSLWAAWEGRRLEMRSWWLPVPASFLVGVCFAVPLFLLMRGRALSARSSEATESEPAMVKA